MPDRRRVRVNLEVRDRVFYGSVYSDYIVGSSGTLNIIVHTFTVLC